MIVNCKPVALTGWGAICAGCAALVKLAGDPTYIVAWYVVVKTHADPNMTIAKLASPLLLITIGGLMALFGRAPHIGGWLKGWGLNPDRPATTAPH